MAGEDDKKDLIVERVIDAPVEEVWEAWVDPEYVMQWCSPEGFTTSIVDMDVREGGTSLVCMHPPEGEDVCNTWSYGHIEPGRRLEFITHFADTECNPVDPAEWDMPGMPAEIPTEVTLEAAGEGKTKITYVEHGHTSDEMMELGKQGLDEALDKLSTIFEAR